MKTKIYPKGVALIFILLFFTSCKSVNKLYDNGDYDQTVYAAIKKIEKINFPLKTKK